MKKFFYILGLFLFLSSIFVSCENDPTNLDDVRDEIAKSWSMTLTGDVTQDYQVNITKDYTDDTKINLSNFVNNGSSAYGTVTGHSITVPEQSVGNSVVSATGTISDDYSSISWSLTIDGDYYSGSMTPGGITKLELAR